jgi:hypothetical protein
MTTESKTIKTLWVLKGDHTVEGWKALEADARADKIPVLIFDRTDGWALVRSETAPEGYEGMSASEPKDGLWVSEHGYPIYVVDCKEVRGPREVIRAIGGKAEALLEELGDPDAVLQRLGHAY